MRTPCLLAVIVMVAVASGCSLPDAASPEIGTGPVRGPACLDAIPVLLTVRDAPVADIDERLTFVLFENGANDLMFVDVAYGTWSSGEFDLRHFDRLIYTGRVPRALFVSEGVLIDIGDVVSPRSRGLRVTRVAGDFK